MVAKESGLAKTTALEYYLVLFAVWESLESLTLSLPEGTKNGGR